MLFIRVGHGSERLFLEMNGVMSVYELVSVFIIDWMLLMNWLMVRSELVMYIM